jgi:hypothetical protein
MLAYEVALLIQENISMEAMTDPSALELKQDLRLAQKDVFGPSIFFFVKGGSVQPPSSPLINIDANRKLTIKRTHANSFVMDVFAQ